MTFSKTNATALLAAALLILAGCSTTEPVSLGAGQYSISSTNYLAWSGAGQQSDAVRAANDFCAKSGRIARITSMSATDAVAYRSVASGQVTFVCEEKSGVEEPVALAGGVYMLAGSASGYQGIKARYKLMKAAAAFCARHNLKVEPVADTRERGNNLTSGTDAASTGHSAESALQNSSADLLFRCAP